MSTNPSTISPELFKTINADVSAFIRQRLLAMQVEVGDLELHNSSLTRTLRVYLTVKRTANLKALHLAEQIIMSEVARKFLFRPHAFYWRYVPDTVEAASSESAASSVAVENASSQTHTQS